MKHALLLVMGIAGFVLSPFFVQAQMLDPVTYEIVEAPESVEAGEIFEVTVRAEIEGEWHLYSINNPEDAGPFPTRLSSPQPQLAVAGTVRESEPVIAHDPNFDVELGWHSSQATFTVPLAFQTEVSGESMIDLEIFYQVCDDRSCLPPKTKSVTGGITVAGVAAQPFTGFGEQETAAAQNPGSGNGEITRESPAVPATAYAGGGILSFLGIALTAGFAALLTPCVFPMVPLTVSFFSKQSEGRPGRATGQALLFGMMIVVTFTVLGALLAALIGASGANRFAANPWVNLFIGSVLILFACSLLGMFELRLPHQLTNWLNRKSNESSGLAGILFMSLTISAVSFSCTAPFVGGVLAATSGGEWFYPVIGMAGFSAAFASPFVLFALFPRWLESLPRSGSWMNVVKVLLGFIELAAAIKFISNADLVWGWGVVSRPLAIAAWIAIFMLASFYILGTYSLKHETRPEQIGTGRLFLAMPFMLFTVYLIPGLLGASLGIWDSWLPPRQATDVSVVYSIAQNGGAGGSAEFENWSEDYEASMEAAAENAMPVFVDFTGYTCTNCRAMEANVFPLQAVQERFDQMEKVRIYTDDGAEGPDRQRFQFQLTGTVALPTYVIIDPYSGEVLQQLVGYADRERFQAFLDAGLSGFSGRTASPTAASR